MFFAKKRNPNSAARRPLREVAPRSEAAEREDLYGLINDLEKDAYGFRMRRDLTSWTTQKLRDEVEYLSDRIRSDIESEEYEASRREELEASESEIAGLMPTAAEMEQERMPVGKSARRYEGKMKITRSALARIIKEEVARALQEAMEVINADSGEVLTLPPELEVGYVDGQELMNDEFEALRTRVMPKRSTSPRSRWSPDHDVIDAALDYPGSPSTATAVERLMLLAREAADDWMADNPGSDIADVAYDLADGLRWISEGDDWADAVDHFGSKADLVSALAEEMAG
jgi:hypothetical protein